MAQTPPRNNGPDQTGPHSFNLSMPRQSAGLKLLLVCALAVVMIVPALLVYGIVQERSAGLDRAIGEVSSSVGGEQNVLGPVLAVPYSRAPDPKKPDHIVYGIAVAYAETGEAQSTVNVAERQRGIHTIPVFDAEIGFTATFDPEALRGAVPSDASAIWSDARLYMGVSDTRGIKEAIRIVVRGSGSADRRLQMEPAKRVNYGEGYEPVPMAGVSLAGGRIDGLQSMTAPFTVNANLRLTGAQRLAVGPFAKNTSFDMDSNWHAPSFGGGVLPDTHTAGQSDAGFSASWRVPYLARGIQGAGARLDLSEVTSWNYREMAVRFINEVSPYQSMERALKYAAMFIGFVFLAYFLFEVTSGARAHPAQYVLVGLAQCIFYLLLLAFSERFGFDAAFGVAATMTVMLTTFYAANVFRSLRYGLKAFVILSGIYGLNYVLMRADEQALIAGALASFIAIAVTMFMTRNVDWYGDRKPLPA